MFRFQKKSKPSSGAKRRMKIKLKVRKIFFPIYNGVRFFCQHYMSWAIFALLIIYLPFQCRILFFPGYFLASLFPLEISLQDIFFGLKSPTTPQKWIGRPLKSTKRLLSRLILICQSLLKPFATIGDKTLQESGRIRFYLPLPAESVRWRQKQIFWDGWPIFLCYGSTRARRLRY